MAKFHAKVTQEGWCIEVETNEGSGESTATVERLSTLFIDSQTSLQIEGQKVIREAFQTDISGLKQKEKEYEAGVHAISAETIADQSETYFRRPKADNATLYPEDVEKISD